MGQIHERDRTTIYPREPNAGRRDELYGNSALVEEKASTIHYVLLHRS